MAKAGTSRHSWRWTLIASVTMAVVALLPQSVAAATSIGQAADGATCSAGTGMDTVQTASALPLPGYMVPDGSWQVTGWSAEASSQMDSTLQLEIWRPTTTADTFILVGIGSPQTLLTDSGVNTYPLAAPIAVQTGDLLGLRVTGLAGCSSFTGNFTGDAYRLALGTPSPTPGSNTVFPYLSLGVELNVAATLEASAPPPPPVPTTMADCIDGGWQSLTDDQGMAFTNQGDCISFVATDGRNTAGG
jgi:hypothetical protein